MTRKAQLEAEIQELSTRIQEKKEELETFEFIVVPDNKHKFNKTMSELRGSMNPYFLTPQHTRAKVSYGFLQVREHGYLKNKGLFLSGSQFSGTIQWKIIREPGGNQTLVPIDTVEK